MVFADVSGFTRLSERLARAGEEGRAARRRDQRLLHGPAGRCVRAGWLARQVRRRCDAPVLLRRRAHGAGLQRGGRDAAHAARVGHIRAGPPTSCCGCRRRAPRLLPDVRGRRLAPRAPDRRRGGNDRGGDGERRVFGSDRDQLTNRAALAACLCRRERRPGIPACAFPVGRRLGLPARACGSH